jgi:hypothetical protein
VLTLFVVERWTASAGLRLREKLRRVPLLPARELPSLPRLRMYREGGNRALAYEDER